MKKSVYIIQCPPSWVKTAPLSLVYLENYLKNCGVRVKTRDLNIEFFKASGLSLKGWLSLNQEFEKSLFQKTMVAYPSFLKSLYKDIADYDYIGFSIFKRNADFSFLLADVIKEKFPAKAVIFGGPEALSMVPADRANHNGHWVIGEGELALAKIVGEDKKETYPFEEISDLDALPFLNFGCLGMENYSNSIPLFSSRGCKFNCRFCAEKKLYKNFRHHSAGYMAEMIGKLKNEYDINNFVFCDSLINYDDGWLEKLCSLLIEKNISIKWEAQMRVAKSLDVDLGRLMKKSGCYNLFIGLESASEHTLKRMNKGFDTQTAADFLLKLRNSGLQFEISLIFGYPGETDTDFKETLDFITKNKKIIPKIAQANPFVDYLGNFPGETFPSETAKKRIKTFLKVIETEKIRYTKSFINNLVY